MKKVLSLLFAFSLLLTCGLGQAIAELPINNQIKGDGGDTVVVDSAPRQESVLRTSSELTERIENAIAQYTGWKIEGITLNSRSVSKSVVSIEPTLQTVNSPSTKIIIGLRGNLEHNSGIVGPATPTPNANKLIRRLAVTRLTLNSCATYGNNPITPISVLRIPNVPATNIHINIFITPRIITYFGADCNIARARRIKLSVPSRRVDNDNFDG